MLIVDRDDSIRDVLYRYFKARGFTADAAANGYEALALARAKTYDLIVAEDGLSGGNGAGLIGKIRRSSPDAYLIAISDFPNPGELYRAGADNYIRKPFSLLDFECLLKRYFAVRGGWQGVRAHPGQAG
jgi:DNA-binding response OmpR family regulator